MASFNALVIFSSYSKVFVVRVIKEILLLTTSVSMNVAVEVSSFYLQVVFIII